jgi:ribosomal-protein-serine acetyltransferase
VTPAIAIRPYTLEDADASYDAILESMDALIPWMPWCVPGYPPERQRAWVEMTMKAFQDGTTHEFAIVSSEGRYLGGCGLNGLDTLNRRANLGYWVRSSAAGQGIATAATLLVRAWAFEHTDLVRLEIVASLRNEASVRVAEKAGARREGTLRSRLLLHGVHHDAALFAFVRETAPA